MATSKYKIKKKYGFWYLSFDGWYGMTYLGTVMIGSYKDFEGAVAGIWTNELLPAMKQS